MHRSSRARILLKSVSDGQVLGTEELNSYLNKYRLELDPNLAALVGRLVNLVV